MTASGCFLPVATVSFGSIQVMLSPHIRPEKKGTEFKGKRREGKINPSPFLCLCFFVVPFFVKGLADGLSDSAW